MKHTSGSPQACGVAQMGRHAVAWEQCWICGTMQQQLWRCIHDCAQATGEDGTARGRKEPFWVCILVHLIAVMHQAPLLVVQHQPNTAPVPTCNLA